MKKDIIVVCPDCNNPIYIYDKETVCFCKKCKSDYKITRNDNGYNLERVENIDKDKALAKNRLRKYNIMSFFLIILLAIGALIFSVLVVVINDPYIRNQYNNNTHYTKDTESDKSEEISFLADINKISEDDFKIIDEAAEGKIIFESRFDQQNGFDIIGKCKRNKVYLLNKKDNNLFIPVYLCTYSNNKTTYNVYSPVVYENVKYNYETNEFLKYFPPASNNTAPKVYLSSDQSEYTIGYLSFDELYNKFIKPLENEYRISEKSY